MIGTCRFCGQLREVNAPDQVRADEKAQPHMRLRRCRTLRQKAGHHGGGRDHLRKLQPGRQQITVLQAIALAVDDGVVVKASLTVGGLSVKVGSKSNGNTFVKITQKQEDDREITRYGVK